MLSFLPYWYGVETKERTVTCDLHFASIFSNYSLRSEPLFTEVEKNNCFSIYTRIDLKNSRIGSHLKRGKRASKHEAFANLYTESLNMANLVYLRENPRHDLANGILTPFKSAILFESLLKQSHRSIKVFNL